MDKEWLEILNEMDNTNPFDLFNNFYNKSADYEKVHAILNEVLGYDVFDFIARISALNLLPENQNKSILFDTLIASLLTLERNMYTSTNKMSSGRFRKIIKQLDSLDLKMGEDPAENVFIENVMFYDNYSIFPGINYLPGYCLQTMINTLFLRDNSYSTQFLQQASRLIQLVLNLSDRATTELNLNLNNLEYIEKANITIPKRKKLDHLAELVLIDNDYLKLLIGNDFLIDELYSEFEQSDIESVLNTDQQKFFVKPFLRVDDNKSVILNISILPSFIIHKTIWLADKFGYKEELINDYNLSAWIDSRRSFKALGHGKIKESEWGINLLERNDYKEVLLNVCNNQVMILMFICDDGKEYSKDRIFDMYPSKHHSNLVEKRVSYLYQKLNNQKIKNEDIFQTIIINSYGRGVNLRLKQKYNYRPFVLNPFELKCITVNENSDAIFLPRYIKAKSRLISGPPTLFSELNCIELYVNNQYSFYLNDEFNPKNTPIYIAPGDSIDYISRALKKERRHLVESYTDEYLTEVILNDQVRNIYADTGNGAARASLLVKFSNINIWIYSPEIKDVKSLNLYFSIVDAISYWLGECREIIECYNFTSNTIKLRIKLTGNIQEYYYKAKNSSSLKELLDFKIKENNIILTWTPESFKTLNVEDNSNEKQMIIQILDTMEKFTIEGNINK